ncbi:hypothetical protein [Sphaerimonospora thailandensis]|uniref:Uncharacterized protein n=1 Tax=Sphaerimonospora thailandensis TaxID=795644 RepID=A0A8J3RDE4_9ACTN|nr:hypothetical protein [Sphaerimonospora thailandensis]GIH72231.1 hypothetical protein Mth01_44840 [Sphaerimonospora thailandensis]
MINAFAAEALQLRKRLAPIIIGGSWLVMVVGFGFAVPYIVYAALDPVTQAAERAQLLGSLLPSAVHHAAAGSYPLFGGAVMLILGVLITGSEYRWRTWPARLSQGPTRTHRGSDAPGHGRAGGFPPATPGAVRERRRRPG